MKNIVFQFIQGREFKTILFLYFFIWVVLFCISPDSYTHDLTNRVDTAIFFMCGKAWMNGMLPYVDFADSKGPLLWLIYGIGYLISHYDYVGMFWISTVFFTVALYFCYKIALLYFNNNHRVSLMTAVTMSLPLLIYLCHSNNEIRAEDYCVPFVLASLYQVLKYAQEKTSNLAVAAFYVGFSTMACFLIKWSIAVMMFSFCFAILYYAWKRGLLLKSVIGGIGGAVLLAAPFIIYLVSVDCFSAFVQEYFVNTTRTVSSSLRDTLNQYFLVEWPSLLGKRRFYLLLSLAASMCLSLRYKRWSCWPTICTLWFLSLSIRHDNWFYYVVIDGPFCIFMALLFVELLSKIEWIRSCAGLICFTFLILIVDIYQGTLRSPNMFYDTLNRKDYYAVAYLMNQIEKPTIVCQGPDVGLGVSVGVLPGCRYWTRQTGETLYMQEERIESIKQQRPDFVVVPYEEINSEFISLLNENGYTRYLSLTGNTLGLAGFYGRYGLKLQLPPVDFEVSDMDVLLKRRIFK